MAVIIFAVAEPSFIQGLLTAICSAIVSGVFLLVSTHISQKKTEAKVKEVLDNQDKVKTALEKSQVIDPPTDAPEQV